MSNKYVEAKLVNFATIRVLIYNANRDVRYIFTLITNFKDRVKINGRVIDRKDNSVIYEFRLPHQLELGNDYQIAITDIGIYPLNVSALAELPEFDKKYHYDGDDLGVTYSKKCTKFALWAPLASIVFLRINDQDTYMMNRTDKGVYRYCINEDLKGATYNYFVKNSGVVSKTTDPYAKASTPNAMSSVILDLEKLEMNMHDKKLDKMHSILDAIIYEGSVRDLTSDPNTDIEHKGKFLGLVENKRKNLDGLPVGFDYICDLGITHLQLLPVADFVSTDELNPENSYNWGYDPGQLFVPEGSYASKVNDPTSRIEDYLTLVSRFHSRGIRIVNDVVFNHVFEHLYSSLEAVVPNYYFRRTKDGGFFNASGCGNDVASERSMVRKLIVDACKWWVSYYHIDGFRFDLMGLLDAETMNEIRREVTKIRPDFIIYGEGWNMFSGYNLTLANMNNYLKNPHIAYFNDWYRDTIVGNLYTKDVGFGLDNIVYRDDFKDVECGSAFNTRGGGSKFNSVTRTINFVECHDNNTLFDKLDILRPNDKLEDKLKRINFINALVMFSFGVPFFHAGQEIGLSKGGNGNSYNAGDKVNMFNYSLLKERKEMVEYFKYLTKTRKGLDIYHNTNMEELDKDISFFDIDNGGVHFAFDTTLAHSESKNRVNLFVNPSFLPLFYNKGDKEGGLYIEPISVKITVE